MYQFFLNYSLINVLTAKIIHAPSLSNYRVIWVKNNLRKNYWLIQKLGHIYINCVMIW